VGAFIVLAWCGLAYSGLMREDFLPTPVAVVVTRVLAPATMPGVMDTQRVTLGWAWT
jgi:ABC-type nitrate/sulfonate/bicarbonate transport system permease component